MPATIRDIAKMVGVSPSTVSRVLTGNATISDETKEKIYAAMQALNYHPNSLARSLANGTAGAIAMIVNADDQRTFANLFFHRSLLAAERVMQRHGYDLIISNDAIGAGKGSPVEKLILERKVDGLLLPPSTVTPKLTGLMAKSGFPYVVMGEPEQNTGDADWVDVNNRDGAEQAVFHLYAQGYRRLAFLGGSQGQKFVLNRIKGYRAGLQQHQTSFEAILETDGTPEAAYEAALQLFSGDEPPDGLLCNDNLCAYGALKALKACGLACPRDMGIVTFDDQPLAPFTDPPLTAVDIDTAALGEQAARLLLSRIRHPSAHQHILLSVSMLERESTMRGIT